MPEAVRAGEEGSFGLVELRVIGAYFYGCIPEVRHHLHSAGIIPNIRRYQSAGRCYPRHLSHHGFVIPHEVQDQTRYRHVPDGRIPTLRGRISRFEAGARVSDALLRLGHKAFRRVDAGDQRRLTHRQDGGCQRPRTAADISPREARRKCDPAKKLDCDRSAPTPNILLVGVTRMPDLCCRFTHSVITMSAQLLK